MIKLEKFLILFFSWILYTSLVLAQEPLDYFPHHLGDIWEYWFWEYPSFSEIRQNEVTKDSLGNDGRYYIETTIFGNFVLDTATCEVYNYYSQTVSYKLDADSGDSWVIIEDTSGLNSEFIAVVRDVYQDFLFGQLVSIKVIDYIWHNISLSESLYVYTDYLASNFGLIQVDTEFSHPNYLIRGAIIDSILYGIVTSIEPPQKPGFPYTFVLHQNYPNPFNPATTIKYELPIAAKVELTVYDMLGRRVRTLVNAEQTVGNYEVQFDGRDLSSGVYIYRLRVNNKAVLSRKMVLIK